VRSRKQTESGWYAGVEDPAHAIGVDRTYVGRVLRLISLAPDIVEAILRGEEPEGISLSKAHRNLPVQWAKQRHRWCSEG